MKQQPALLFLFFSSLTTLAQPSEFQKLYGNNAVSLIGYELALSSDNNILFCGAKYAASNDAMLLKLNIAGDTLWTKYYDAGAFEIFSTVKELADGSIITGGSLDTLAFLNRTDDNGNVIWSKVIAASHINTVREILPLADSGFIGIADGYAQSCIFRMSADGTVEWIASFELNYNDVIQLNDGNLIACGSRSTFPSILGFSDISLLKITSSGNVVWEKLLGNSVYQSAVSMIQGNDSNLYICGQQNDPAGDSEILMVKTDTGGTPQWSKIFNAGSQDVAIEISSLFQDQLMINGHSANAATGASYGFLLRTDESGNMQWFRNYGDTISNGCWSMLNIDSGYIFSGHTSIFNAGSFTYRAVLGRTDLNGYTGCYESSPLLIEQSVTFTDTLFNSYLQLPVSFIDTAVTITGGTAVSQRCPLVNINEIAQHSVLVYPNPTADVFNFTMSKYPCLLQVFDNSGKLIINRNLERSTFQFNIVEGFYYYRISFYDGFTSGGKLVKL